MEGLLIGIFCFVMISIFYPFVKKKHCCFAEKVWPLFLMAGIGCMIGAVFIQEFVWSAMLAVTGIMFLWSISEIKGENNPKQEEVLHIKDAELLCSRKEENQNLKP